jgi:hypothetical protein
MSPIISRAAELANRTAVSADITWNVQHIMVDKQTKRKAPKLREGFKIPRLNTMRHALANK